MPQAWQVVLKVGKSEAVDALRIALDTVPTDGDTRSEFFIQWRHRTLTDLEKIFQETSPPVRRFREIEFSPRRFSGDEDQDNVMRRDACLSGCAVECHLLQMILDRLSQSPDGQPPAPNVGEATAAAAAAAVASPAVASSAPAKDAREAVRPQNADASDSSSADDETTDSNDTEAQTPDADEEPNA